MVESAPEPCFQLEAYAYEAATGLASALGLSRPVATALVRRGYADPEAAARFLAASESYGPERFEGIEQLVATVRGVIAAGGRITVFGDFDVDGVCATSVTVACLRRLGANCDWLIPDRLTEGYGFSLEAVDALADRGTELLLTVDNGITAVEAVVAARERGIEVIVTDHHRPGEELPECPILHPAVCGYPCEELCGAAVAWKLCQALAESEPVRGENGDREQGLERD
ncbi:MAG TPA: DHH family phosphoesterase, partial [Solirubrobacterales bacterium]|nr:DHH family phosphoesterase [Solirubrobacterales bacterium]